MTAGIPVAMKTHCHPAIPYSPSRIQQHPPKGAPTALAIALKIMNKPTIVPR